MFVSWDFFETGFSAEFDDGLFGELIEFEGGYSGAGGLGDDIMGGS